MFCHLYNLAGSHISSIAVPERMATLSAIKRAAGGGAELLFERSHFQGAPITNEDPRTKIEGVFALGPLTGCFVMTPASKYPTISPEKLMTEYRTEQRRAALAVRDANDKTIVE